MPKTLYTDRFFNSCTEGSLTSAREIVPYLRNLTECRSVVDVGCGLGTWLSVFQEQGVTDFHGFDGNYIDQSKLLIPRDHFTTADLTSPPTVARRFDLAICLEVAEHLPKSAEKTLLDFLTGLSDVVAFSASIPFQNGTGHVNEQWLEYWVASFESRGYRAVDCIRPHFWSHEQIEWWYIQNTVIYVKKAQLGRYPKINAVMNSTLRSPFSQVHPRLFLLKQNLLTTMPMFDSWRLALSRTWQAVKKRLNSSEA